MVILFNGVRNRSAIYVLNAHWALPTRPLHMFIPVNLLGSVLPETSPAAIQRPASSPHPGPALPPGPGPALSPDLGLAPLSGQSSHLAAVRKTCLHLRTINLVKQAQVKGNLNDDDDSHKGLKPYSDREDSESDCYLSRVTSRLKSL